MRPASADTDLDRAFLLDTVGALRSQDNVDGLFAEYVQAAYKDYFGRTSRFVYQDLSRADDVLSHSKVPYSKLLDDNKVLLQVARSARTQTLIKTKIRKEGPQYRVSIEWLNAPRMDLLANESFVLPEGNELDSARAELQKGLARMVAKVPWKGHITGRDGESVTINIGANSGLSAGDEIVIGTLDEAKRHPLLNAVVDWRLSRTGKLVVESVDEKIAFCKVLEEEPGRQVLRNQKILTILHKPADQVAPTQGTAHRARMGETYDAMEDEGEGAGDPDGSDSLDRKPRLGLLHAGIALGKFSRDYNTSASTGMSGSSGLFGARLGGQLWVTSEFFADLALGFHTGSYTQKSVPGNADTGVSASSGLTIFKIDGGYTMLGSVANLDAPRAGLKFGYMSDAYDLPFSNTELTGPLTFKSIFIGFTGDLPIQDGFGARLDLDFGLFNSITESGLNSGDSNGVSNVQVAVGAYYRFRPRLVGKLDLEVLSQNVDFANNASISHRAFAVIPGIEFYF